jgi:hypothetical protein
MCRKRMIRGFMTFYCFQEFHARRQQAQQQRPRQRYVRPPQPTHLVSMTDPAPIPSRQQVHTAMTVSDDQATLGNEEDIVEDPNPPFGSRGGFQAGGGDPQHPRHHPRGQQQHTSASSGSTYLGTLDRRPGRPAFHHMGPPSGSGSPQSPRTGAKVPRNFRQQQQHSQVRILVKCF